MQPGLVERQEFEYIRHGTLGVDRQSGSRYRADHNSHPRSNSDRDGLCRSHRSDGRYRSGGRMDFHRGQSEHPLIGRTGVLGGRSVPSGHRVG
jgi:hypothetical protein